MTDTQLEGLTRAALEIVTSDRNEQYGEPEDSFQTIAELWQGYLRAKGNIQLDAVDVARMLQLFKMARRMTAVAPSADSFIDGIGYLLCEAKTI